MSTTRQRRAGAAPLPYAVDEDGDRVYTEEDYVEAEPAQALPDEWEPGQGSYAAADWAGEELPEDGEAFQPDDEEEAVPEGEWEELAPDGYDPYGEDSLPPYEEAWEDLDPLSDELLTDEERAELKRSHWQLLSGLADFAGVILGTGAILVLLTLLISLVNWLVNDLSQSFLLLQKNL